MVSHKISVASIALLVVGGVVVFYGASYAPRSVCPRPQDPTGLNCTIGFRNCIVSLGDGTVAERVRKSIAGSIADEKLASPAAQIYVQFLDEEVGLHSHTERVRFWIGQLEGVLQDVDDPVLSYHIIFSLADLYRLMNDNPVSEDLFSHIFLSQSAPEELRIAAGNNFLASKRLRTLSLSPEYLDFFVRYD